MKLLSVFWTLVVISSLLSFFTFLQNKKKGRCFKIYVLPVTRTYVNQIYTVNQINKRAASLKMAFFTVKPKHRAVSASQNGP